MVRTQNAAELSTGDYVLDTVICRLQKMDTDYDEVPYDKSMEADDFYNLSDEEKEKLDKEYQEFLEETWLPF